jgi:hypothetical protein
MALTGLILFFLQQLLQVAVAAQVFRVLLVILEALAEEEVKALQQQAQEPQGKVTMVEQAMQMMLAVAVEALEQ